MSKTEEVVAKLGGVGKQVQSMLTGHRGILNTLAKEHGEVSALMNQIVATQADMPGQAKRRELFPKVRAELLAHAKAEEGTLYSALQHHPEARDAARHAVAEHDQVKLLLDELQSMNVDAMDWMPKFQELVARVRTHVEEEEHDLFDIAKTYLESSRLEALQDAFKDSKRRELENLGQL